MFGSKSATRLFSTEKLAKPNIYVRFLRFERMKGDLYGSPIDFLESHVHYGTAMRQHAGFHSGGAERRAKPADHSISQRPFGGNGADPRMRTAKTAHDGAAF
jgi:hypothetical protein